MGFSIFVARHYLFSGKASGATSRMSVIAIIVSAIAIAVPLIVLSVLNGFHENIKDTRLERSFHLKINCAFDAIPTEWIQRMETDEAFYVHGKPSIRIATPLVEGEALLNRHFQSEGVLFRGVDAHLLESDSFKRSFIIKEGRGSFDLKGNKMVIGKALADKLFIPDPLTETVLIWLITEKKEMKDGKEISYFEPVRFGVTGIFESGLQELDGSLILLSIESAQKQVNTKGITGIGIQLYDKDTWSDVKDALIPLLTQDKNYYCSAHQVLNWERMNSHMFFALEWEKTLLSLVMSMMLIASFLTIFLALNVVVMDKRKEIGILLSLGVHPKKLVAIFTTEGLLIGLTGGVVGLILGIWGTIMLTEILHSIEAVVTFVQAHVYHSLIGWWFWDAEPEPFKLVHSRIFTTDFIPYKIRLPEIAMLFIGSVGIAWIASLLPALRASKEKPMEILHYE